MCLNAWSNVKGITGAKTTQVNHLRVFFHSSAVHPWRMNPPRRCRSPLSGVGSPQRGQQPLDFGALRRPWRQLVEQLAGLGSRGRAVPR